MVTATQSNETPGLDDSAIQSLRSRLGGDVLSPSHDDYHAARAVWNGMIDRRPALIARCASTADVVHAIEFATSRGLAAAVRGGGHNAAGLAVCDGGMVIDLTPMRAVTVDPEAKTAKAGGGATWGDFDRATQAHGLAATGGVISTTGVGGLTLGGGLGWLMRSQGLACDNLIAAEVVTASGEIVHASETENPELLWGLRGGGGNFGVVTEFTFRLRPLTTVLGGLLVHPIERAAETLAFYREFTASAPDELTVFAGLMTSPEGMKILGVIACWAGDPAEGEKALAPLRAFGPPVADMIAPMPYAAMQSMLDEGFPAGQHVYWRAHFLKSLSDETIETLIDRFQRTPSPLNTLIIEQLGGAVARIGRDQTAFDHRDAPYNLAIIGRWTEPSEADANIAWARELWDATAAGARGVYVNYLGVGDSEERVRAAYGAEKYDRLAALKARWDPDNFFRFNQNIKPAAR